MDDGEIIVALREITKNISNEYYRDLLKDLTDDLAEECCLCPKCGGEIEDNFIDGSTSDCRGLECEERINEQFCSECGYIII